VIVVDTTVWIDFFNGAGTPGERCNELLLDTGLFIVRAVSG
jgi:predicted nucleic acid-binding protein